MRLGDDAYKNSGCGLDAADSRNLATVLRQQLLIGATQSELEAQAQFDEAPPPVAESIYKVQEFLCLLIDGTSAQPQSFCLPSGELVRAGPRELTVKDVESFVDFLEHCGGFEIW